MRLVIEFDGTNFCGWAEQPGLRTVKGTLKSCIRQVGGEDVDLRGASRTDSGAHAKRFVADFQTENPMPPQNWLVALNRQLDGDARVLKCERVAAEFHSRFYARSRVYEYRIVESEKVDPRRARYVCETWRHLDAQAMQSAVKHILGRHDFRAFGEELGDMENAVREVKAATVERFRDEIRFTIEATAFIRGMVRRIAGGLFEVGYGRRSVDEFEALIDLARRDEIDWPIVLPAKGLTLLKVKYGKKLRDLRTTEDFE